jgi:HAD superfamily PSPase-like hydrolase
VSYKAIAFDLDGTLVKEKSSWNKLHTYYGTLTQSKSNMHDYEAGKITYDTFMALDISLWQPRPSKKEIENILLSYNLSDNAKKIVNTLKKKEYNLLIITTAPNILANAVATELGINHVLCNEFIFDENDLLMPNAKYGVDLIRKDLAFKKAMASNGLECEECMAVGDSKYDINFLKSAGLGIAYNPDDELRKEALPKISDLEDLLNFI